MWQFSAAMIRTVFARPRPPRLFKAALLVCQLTLGMHGTDDHAKALTQDADSFAAWDVHTRAPP